MEVGAWREAIEEFLRSSKTVVQLAGQRTFLRGALGEVLALRQLTMTYGENLRRGANRIDYYGGQRKGFDILLKLDGRDVKLDCKEKTGENWARNYARNYLEISWDGEKRQHIHGILRPEAGLFYVLVDSAEFLETGNVGFFVLSDAEMKQTVKRIYSHMNGRRRPRNPKSTHFAFGVDEVADYRDNQLTRWKLQTS